MRHVHPAAPWLAQVGGDPHGTRLRGLSSPPGEPPVRRRRPPTSTRREEWEALYGPLDARARPRRRDPGRLRRARLRRRPAAQARPTSRRSAPLAEASFFRDASKRDRAAARRREDAHRSSATARSSSSRARARREEQFAARARRGRADSGRRGDREDPRPARGQAGPAGGRARDGAPPERGARGRAEVADDDRADRRRRHVLERPARRPRRARIDRPRRARIGTAASRRGMTTRAGERRRTAEEKIEEQTDVARGARAGDPRRGGRDRREVGREGAGDRGRRGAARGRPTCGSSSWRSCGFPPPDPGARARHPPARRLRGGGLPRRTRRRERPRGAHRRRRHVAAHRRPAGPARPDRRARARLECFGAAAERELAGLAPPGSDDRARARTRPSTTATASAASSGTSASRATTSIWPWSSAARPLRTSSAASVAATPTICSTPPKRLGPATGASGAPARQRSFIPTGRSWPAKQERAARKSTNPGARSRPPACA